jgi:excisionase family DNA binding protein
MEALYETSRIEPLLTIRQVGEVLGISRASIYRLIDAGELEPIKVGTLPRFAPEDLRGYIERKRSERGP